MWRHHGEAGIRASGLALPSLRWVTWGELSVGLGISMGAMSRLSGPQSVMLASVRRLLDLRGYGSGREEPSDVSRTASFLHVSIHA